MTKFVHSRPSTVRPGEWGVTLGGFGCRSVVAPVMRFSVATSYSELGQFRERDDAALAAEASNSWSCKRRGSGPTAKKRLGGVLREAAALNAKQARAHGITSCEHCQAAPLAPSVTAWYHSPRRSGFVAPGGLKEPPSSLESMARRADSTETSHWARGSRSACHRAHLQTTRVVAAE